MYRTMEGKHYKTPEEAINAVKSGYVLNLMSNFAERQNVEKINVELHFAKHQNVEKINVDLHFSERQNFEKINV
jgi:hypothetical protein